MHVAVNDPDLCVRQKKVRSTSDCTRQKEIVRVEPTEDVAPSLSEALVERVCLAAVVLAYPEREPTLVLLDDLYASISGAAIHHDVLQSGITLQEHRSHRLLEKIGLVV